MVILLSWEKKNLTVCEIKTKTFKRVYTKARARISCWIIIVLVRYCPSQGQTFWFVFVFFSRIKCIYQFFLHFCLSTKLFLILYNLILNCYLRLIYIICNNKSNINEDINLKVEEDIQAHANYFGLDCMIVKTCSFTNQFVSSLQFLKFPLQLANA